MEGKGKGKGVLVERKKKKHFPRLIALSKSWQEVLLELLTGQDIRAIEFSKSFINLILKKINK